MTIDGPLWFIGALLICGLHALFILNWRAESRARIKLWEEYDAASQQRHDEFMAALNECREEERNG